MPGLIKGLTGRRKGRDLVDLRERSATPGGFGDILPSSNSGKGNSKRSIPFQLKTCPFRESIKKRAANSGD